MSVVECEVMQGEKRVVGEEREGRCNLERERDGETKEDERGRGRKCEGGAG